MRIWHWNPDTRVLLGEGVADPDPMEEGAWLLPAHSTEQEPPTAVEGQIIVWINDGWASLPAPVEPPQPVVVSAVQIRMALTRAGLRSDFEALVAHADQDTKDLWAFAPGFSSEGGAVVGGLPALGQTPAQIAALFELAKTL